MSATYSWVISSLECVPEQDGKENVVCTVHWRRQAHDGAVMGDIYGSQSLTLDPEKTFTLFNDLTEAQIAGWIQSAIGASGVAELDAALDRQIAGQISRSLISPPLPW